MLMMSATPIPRTLAMSYYADLDVSVIDELPPGRTPVVTKLIADSRKDEVIARIGAQVAAGRQVYWVCPLIEESEALDLSNATATHQELSESLPGVLVGLLHSRMPAAEKKAVMAQFSAGQMGVLVSTTVIDELPPGRTPVVTKLIADSRKDEVIARIGAQVAAGRQVYWVCPLIEESEALDLSNATATHQELSESLPGVLVGLLHSRMPAAEKKAVMAQFSAGQMGVLVSTTVIEVGVDVPNASLMVIEHAERFGLSQLHQLRGRVGRGAVASACVLLYATNDSGRVGETAKERLRAMQETNDGFEIARRDLEIRGPGEFLGARQSGDALLRFADLATDTALLEWARALASSMLDHHPDLARQHVARWLGGRQDYLKA